MAGVSVFAQNAQIGKEWVGWLAGWGRTAVRPYGAGETVIAMPRPPLFVIPSDSRGIPTEPTNHSSHRRPTLPFPEKRQERLGMAMMVPLYSWDSSKGSE